MKKVHTSFFILTFAAFWVGCHPAKRGENLVSTSTENQLTEEEKAAGWKLLFDGQTLAGWRIFKGRKNNTWEVAGGTLHCKALDESTGDGNERSDIMTTEQFENFELSFDWKIAKEGNSGVMFYVTEEFEQPYYSGPEFQLMDDAGFPNETPDHLSGSNYGMHAAGKKTLKPAGEWNSATLVVNKNNVEHWLNGERVVKYQLKSEEWTALKSESKWKDAPGYGMPTKGHIAFQDHGSEVWFRHVKIKPL